MLFELDVWVDMTSGILVSMYNFLSVYSFYAEINVNSLSHVHSDLISQSTLLHVPSTREKELLYSELPRACFHLEQYA